MASALTATLFQPWLSTLLAKFRPQKGKPYMGMTSTSHLRHCPYKDEGVIVKQIWCKEERTADKREWCVKMNMHVTFEGPSRATVEKKERGAESWRRTRDEGNRNQCRDEGCEKDYESCFRMHTWKRQWGCQQIKLKTRQDNKNSERSRISVLYLYIVWLSITTGQNDSGSSHLVKHLLYTWLADVAGWAIVEQFDWNVKRMKVYMPWIFTVQGQTKWVKNRGLWNINILCEKIRRHSRNKNA